MFPMATRPLRKLLEEATYSTALPSPGVGELSQDAPPPAGPYARRVNRDALERSVCRESFPDFFRRFWSEIIAEKLVWNWHLGYLCGRVQEIAERVICRKRSLGDLVINVPPGTSKSTICSIMLPAWLWSRDPTLRVICASYSYHLSMRLGVLCRNVILSDRYRRLFPEVGLVEEQKGLLVNTHGGQRISTSTGGSITGMHGHLIIVDDPVNASEALSEQMLRNANDWLTQTLLTRRIDRLRSPLILIMQRLHQNDPSANLLEKQLAGHICLPSERTDRINPKELAEHYSADGYLDARRLGKEACESARQDLGEYGYAGQYLQHPVPLSGGMFRPDQIRVIPSSPPLVSVVRYWDKAGTEDKRSPFTAGIKLGRDRDGRFVLADVVRGQWEASQRERIIRQTAEMDGRNVSVCVEQEPGSGGKESAQNTVLNLAGFRVYKDRPYGDKVRRADPLAVQVNGGNLCLVQGDWNAAYLAELAFFPRSRYKDQVDATSGAFAFLTRRKRTLGALPR